MIKLVATDIDGTILIPEGKFRESVKVCICRLQEKGVKVVLVTGRMNKAAEIIRKELGLKTPVVSYQGGLVQHDGNILYERYLSEEIVQKIIKWANEEKIHLNLYNNDTLYSEQDNYVIQRYSSIQHVDYIVKPFSLSNLLSRIEAILRRVNISKTEVKQTLS